MYCTWQTLWRRYSRLYNDGKNVFQKLSEILKERTISLKTKKNIQGLCNLQIPIYWAISSQVKKRQMLWFYRGIEITEWTEYVINEKTQENRNYTETGIYSQDRVDVSVSRSREKCIRECNINKTYWRE